jgi:hypothetical protein
MKNPNFDPNTGKKTRDSDRANKQYLVLLSHVISNFVTYQIQPGLDKQKPRIRILFFKTKDPDLGCVRKL